MDMAEERDDFLNYIKLNTTLWSIEDATKTAESTKVVLVDLLSHDLQIYTTRAILIAKALQKKYGYRLVGLIGDLIFSRELEFDYRKDDAIRLARSFGITDFVDLEEGQPPDLTDDNGQLSLSDIEMAIDALRACPDELLTDQILALRTKENCRLGEFIYEGTIRVSRNPILANARNHLEAVTREAYRIHNIVRKACREHSIEAFVTGHLGYTQWGITADLVLRHGGKAIWFDISGNFSAYLLTRPPADNQTLGSMLRHIDKEIFEREFASKKWPHPEFFKKVERLYYADDFMRPFWVEKTKSPPPEFVPFLRRIALEKLGCPDDRRPVVCVFLHCFSDLPRDDEQVYTDYYDWAAETLKIAANDKSKLWIFKSHPNNRESYDLTDTTERLKDNYKHHENIVFLEDELHRTEIFAVCDLAVSVRGSITYEMSIFGRPVLLAGRSINSDLGFCYVANNEEEYKNLLTTKFHTLKFTPEMRQRAKFYLIYDRVICRVESTMMPYWTYQRLGKDSHWTALSERILHNISDLDPATGAIQRMYEGSAPRIENPRYREIVQVTPIAADAAYHDEVSRSTALRIRVGQTLSFGLGSAATALLSKPYRLDNYGSWFFSNVSASIGFLLEESPSEQLHLALQIFVGRTASVLSINVNGKKQTIRCGSGTRIHLISLDQDILPSERPIVIDISVKAPSGHAVPFRLDGLKVAPLQAIRRYPEHQHFFGYPTEKDGEREFAWMPRQVLLTLPPQESGKQLNVKGYLPFSIHQAKTKVSELVLEVSVNQRRAAHVKAQNDQEFDISIPLEPSTQGADDAINVTLSANSTLPEDADPRELSFIVTDIAISDRP